MSVIRTTWSKPYAEEFDSIFRKKVPKNALLCSHREQTGEFCKLHQGGCGLHSSHEPDGRCECQPCDPKPTISNIRYAGVCTCEVYEHCAKCDPDFFGAPHPV